MAVEVIWAAALDTAVGAEAETHRLTQCFIHPEFGEAPAALEQEEEGRIVTICQTITTCEANMEEVEEGPWEAWIA